jgi:hypothetical protein
MALPEWQILEQVGNELKNFHLGGPMWQRLLANHVSTCCRLQHTGGAVPDIPTSLEFTRQTPSTSGGLGQQVETVLRLPMLFGQHAPLPPVPFKSVGVADTQERAQEEACRKAFLFLLCIHARVVRIHDSTMPDIERVRKA